MMSLKYRPKRGRSEASPIVDCCSSLPANNINSSRKIQANLARRGWSGRFSWSSIAQSGQGEVEGNWNCTACYSDDDNDDDIHKYEYNIITWRINYFFFVLCCLFLMLKKRKKTNWLQVGTESQLKGKKWLP